MCAFKIAINKSHVFAECSLRKIYEDYGIVWCFGDCHIFKITARIYLGKASAEMLVRNCVVNQKFELEISTVNGVFIFIQLRQKKYLQNH